MVSIPEGNAVGPMAAAALATVALNPTRQETKIARCMRDPGADPARAASAGSGGASKEEGMMPRTRALALAGGLWLALAGSPAPTLAAVTVDLEGGFALSGYNDVQVPNETGTRFSLTGDLEADTGRFGRLRLGYDAGERHHVSALIAPLRLTAQGTPGFPISFEDTVFPAGTALEGRYRFDSYRLTYRYDAYVRPKLRVGVGLSAKIRDAEIALKGANTQAQTKNTGFVPLINFRFDWMPRTGWRIICEGDALAGPQGRAEDVFLGAGCQVSPRIEVKAGYRMLEGGADVDQVYNFALVHHLAAGVVLTL
jgi:hypothetical protein